MSDPRETVAATPPDAEPAAPTATPTGGAAPGRATTPSDLAGVTAWEQRGRTPVREFLRTQTGSAAVLLGATLAALLWANMDDSSYENFWATELSIRLGSHVLSEDLHGWVNSGLMTLFFFVVGLEARREFD